MDQLQTLQWPRVQVLKREEAAATGGFGGTQKNTIPYQKAGNSWAVANEVCRIENAEGPLPPAKEKEQRQLELEPEQVEELAEGGEQQEPSELPTPPKKAKENKRFSVAIVASSRHTSQKHSKHNKNKRARTLF